ncbi:MAG: hypothetical protein CVV39_03315 [Planctomycetes bacterium HGW-Planctomycetes-1]|nr:MAG: hypothetical protein CVV39_03315 [Planctomycetes bacterium HGW-Planctomycetes-1]
MIKSLRKFVLVITATAFLLSSANVFLYLRLAEHEHDEGGHDHKHCPICQQAAVNKTKAIIPNVILTLELPQVIFTNIYKSEIFVKPIPKPQFLG